MKTRKSLKFLVFIGIVFIAASLVSCQARTESSESDILRPVAPDFKLKDLNGNDFSLSQTKGKVVILDFWATWCPPCRMEVPHFKDLYQRYKGKGLVIIGVALDQGGAATVRPFVQTNEIDYPVLMADQIVVASYGGIRSIPTTFIIDRKGRIVEKIVGYRGKDFFESIIKKLL